MVAFSKDEKQKQQRCNNPSLPREYLKALELLGVEARHSHDECERCNPGGSFSPSELQQYSFSTSARVVGDSMGGWKSDVGGLGLGVGGTVFSQQS